MTDRRGEERGRKAEARVRKGKFEHLKINSTGAVCRYRDAGCLTSMKDPGSSRRA